MSLFDAREKEYKKFLFYKYFFGNTKPLIITEGKTDSKYLKAALKKHHKKYPDLIEKIDDDYILKIDFLKHSNTIEYLFNVPEGGEGFKYWYNYFSDKEPSNFLDKKSPLTKINENIYQEMYPNYVQYFENITSKSPLNPTIFLFDNEPSGNLLYNFSNYARELDINSNNLDKIRKNNFYRITKRNSLYVMATPLMNSEKSDIEDLLLARNTTPILKGKPFNKSGGANYYGKEIFAKYVLKHFDQFDFTEFIPLLDAIRDNILDYRKHRKK